MESPMSKEGTIAFIAPSRQYTRISALFGSAGTMFYTKTTTTPMPRNTQLNQRRSDTTSRIHSYFPPKIAIMSPPTLTRYCAAAHLFAEDGFAE
jgi:hypothetical protein